LTWYRHKEALRDTEVAPNLILPPTARIWRLVPPELLRIVGWPGPGREDARAFGLDPRNQANNVGKLPVARLEPSELADGFVLRNNHMEDTVCNKGLAPLTYQ